ncbi:hypothetical protein MRX96_041663 [Rhipicephalus microplus]
MLVIRSLCIKQSWLTWMIGPWLRQGCLATRMQSTGSTPVGLVPVMEQRLEDLELTIADMPGRIFEGVRASFRELWQRELSQIVESITPAVTVSVMSILQGGPAFNLGKAALARIPRDQIPVGER